MKISETYVVWVKEFRYNDNCGLEPFFCRLINMMVGRGGTGSSCGGGMQSQNDPRLQCFYAGGVGSRRVTGASVLSGHTKRPNGIVKYYCLLPVTIATVLSIKSMDDPYIQSRIYHYDLTLQDTVLQCWFLESF